MPAMSPRESLLVGTLLGGVMWFWICALAFTRSYGDFWIDALAPFAVIAAGGFFLGCLATRYWYCAANGIILPIAIANLTCISVAIRQGEDGAQEWLLLLGVVVAISFIFCWAGAFVCRRWFQAPGSGPESSTKQMARGATIWPATGHWSCPSCHEKVDMEIDACWNCGADRQGNPDPEFEPAIAFHPVCGHCNYILIGLNDRFCPECGEPFDPDKKDTPRPLPNSD